MSSDLFKNSLKERHKVVLSEISLLRAECNDSPTPFWHNYHDFRSGAWSGKEGRLVEELSWIEERFNTLFPGERIDEE